MLAGFASWSSGSRFIHVSRRHFCYSYPLLNWHPARRVALSFYCLGSLDLLDLLKEKTNDSDRQNWRDWIWEQQTSLLSVFFDATIALL